MSEGRCASVSSAGCGVRVIGILNVTPDSFSDGGLYLDPSAAVEQAERMIHDGADIIDIGPESTRPGSRAVPADEQVRRALPVITELRRRNSSVTISIDTTVARVAAAAIDAGADMINDTSALRDDPDMPRVAAESGASVILMHRRGTPETMQAGGGPEYDDVVEDIRSFLEERFLFAVEQGIAPDRIIVDPGIGFGKRTEHNLAILGSAGRFGELGGRAVPVLIGASRKRFIRDILALDDPRARDSASAVAAVLAVQNGAAIVRVHDVRGTVDAIKLAHAARRSDVPAHSDGASTRR